MVRGSLARLRTALVPTEAGVEAFACRRKLKRMRKNYPALIARCKRIDERDQARLEGRQSRRPETRHVRHLDLNNELRPRPSPEPNLTWNC